MRLRFTTPAWGRAAALTVAFVCVAALPAFAQPKSKRSPKKVDRVADKTTTDKPADAPATPAVAAKKGPVKEQNFNFDGLGLNGRSRSPQLLYFLERANEELERASLEKRSFIPHMVRSVEEEQL
jgi:hypothetical protein